MDREDAETLARDVVTSVTSYPAPLRAAGDFIEFPAADYTHLLVRGSHIRAVEVRAVAADGGAYTAAVELLQSFKDDDLREAQR